MAENPLPTVAEVGAQLPNDLRSAFDEELETVDFADEPAVERFIDKWWCTAVVANDPELVNGIDPDEPLFPSPIKRD